MKKEMDYTTLGVLLYQLRSVKEEYLSSDDISDWQAVNWTNFYCKTKNEILSYVISEEDSVTYYEAGTETEFIGLTDEYFILSEVVLEKFVKGEYSIEETKAILSIWEIFKDEMMLHYFDNLVPNPQLNIA